MPVKKKVNKREVKEKRKREKSQKREVIYHDICMWYLRLSDRWMDRQDREKKTKVPRYATVMQVPFIFVFLFHCHSGS